MRNKGFSLIEALIIIAIIGILIATTVPNFISYFGQTYDNSAKSAGRNAKLAEEVYYNDRETSIGSYTDDLDLLLEYDRNLTDDPEVTFQFGICNSSGFTLWTMHNRGTGYSFMYQD